MLRVGLTGGIASGKSLVLRRLAERGCRTLDLDRAARDAVAPGSEALHEIEAAFGQRVVKDGALDRGALGALVFADAQARARLNAIVHPRVRELERRWAAEQPERAVLVVDAALLVETGAHLRFDRLVVVHCEPDQQLARLRSRDGLDERAAQARIDAQMPAAQKRAFAHFVIDSSGSLEDTLRATDASFEELRPLAERPAERAEPPVRRLLGGLVHGSRTGPRGLAPASVLRVAAERGGLELEPLAELLEPRARGPWYEAARQAPPDGPAAALAPALVAWTLAARGPDADFLASAAASLARLTHVDASPRAEACLLALLLQDVVLQRTPPTGLAERAQLYRGLAARWGGSDPGDALAGVLEAARAHPDDPRAARAGVLGGADGRLAGALVGAAVGAWDPALAELLERIRAHQP